MFFSLRRKYFPYQTSATVRKSDTIPSTRTEVETSPRAKAAIDQRPNPVVRSVEATINRIWNALRDMLDVDQTGWLQRPQRKIHQPGKEKKRRGENAVDHLPLRDQVHEIARHQECFDRGDEECHGDGQSHTGQVQVVRSDRKSVV